MRPGIWKFWKSVAVIQMEEGYGSRFRNKRGFLDTLVNLYSSFKTDFSITFAVKSFPPSPGWLTHSPWLL